MRIVCTADYQGSFPKNLPEGDMLIVAGDMCSWGSIQELERFNEWLGGQPFKYRVVVAGNHDQDLEELDGHKIFTNATYLQDEGVEIEGFKIWGSPWILPVADWAFMLPEEELKKKWDLIPNDTDILITHMPPFTYGENSFLCTMDNGIQIGSISLMQKTTEIKPKLHVFGHIHEGRGTGTLNQRKLINAALCDPLNNLVNEPIVVDLE